MVDVAIGLLRQNHLWTTHLWNPKNNKHLIGGLWCLTAKGTPWRAQRMQIRNHKNTPRKKKKKTLQETTQYTQCTRWKSSRNHGSVYICTVELSVVPSTCSTGCWKVYEHTIRKIFKYQKHDLFKKNHIRLAKQPYLNGTASTPCLVKTHLPGIGTACAFGAGKVAAASKHSQMLFHCLSNLKINCGVCISR